MSAVNTSLTREHVSPSVPPQGVDLPRHSHNVGNLVEVESTFTTITNIGDRGEGESGGEYYGDDGGGCAPMVSLLDIDSVGDYTANQGLPSCTSTDDWEKGGCGGSRSTLVAYAPNFHSNNNSGVYSGSSSFGSSMCQLGEVLGEAGGGGTQREREDSCVVGGGGHRSGSVTSQRSAQKQAKRERRQNIKRDDAQLAFAGGGDMSHSIPVGGSMKEIVVHQLPPAAAIKTAGSSNDWVAPLINLMGNLVNTDDPANVNSITTPPKSNNKRNDLRSGKRNLMSSWCNNVHTQHQENKISSWIDRVPSTTTESTTLHTPNVSMSVVLSGCGEVLSSAPSMLLSPTSISTTLSANIDNRIGSDHHHHFTEERCVSAENGSIMNDSSSRSTLNQSMPSQGSSFVRGLRGVVGTARTLTDESEQHGNSSFAAISNDEDVGRDVGMELSSKSPASHTAICGVYERGILQPPPSNRPIHNAPFPLTNNHLPTLVSNTTEQHSPSYFKQHRNQYQQCVDQNVYESLHPNDLYDDVRASPHPVMAREGPCTSVVVVEGAGDATCSFGIRTQPITQPKSTNRKSTTSSVSLNECVYNLEHWDDDAYGWFVVPTDNIAVLCEEAIKTTNTTHTANDNNINNNNNVSHILGGSDVFPSTRNGDGGEKVVFVDTNNNTIEKVDTSENMYCPLIDGDDDSLPPPLSKFKFEVPPSSRIGNNATVGGLSNNDETDPDVGRNVNVSLMMDCLVTVRRKRPPRHHQTLKAINNSPLSSVTLPSTTTTTNVTPTSNVARSSRCLDSPVTFAAHAPQQHNDGEGGETSLSLSLNVVDTILTSTPKNTLSTSTIIPPSIVSPTLLRRCTSNNSMTIRSASDVLTAFFAISSSSGARGGVGGVNMSGKDLSCCESQPSLSRYRSVVITSDSSACTFPTTDGLLPSSSSGPFGILGESVRQHPHHAGSRNHRRSHQSSSLILSGSSSRVVPGDGAPSPLFSRTTVDGSKMDDEFEVDSQHVHSQFMSTLTTLQERRRKTLPGFHSTPLLVEAPKRRFSVATALSGGCTQYFGKLAAVPSTNVTLATNNNISKTVPPEMYFFSDVVSNYNVTVDTLTHGASNHTLQLAQPLTGDSARNYRRNEARMQQQSSSSHQQHPAEQEDI